MNVFINQTLHEFQSGATLADAVSRLGAKPPFATAVNMQFVPNSQYSQQKLQANDKIDIIFPVTGG